MARFAPLLLGLLLTACASPPPPVAPPAPAPALAPSPAPPASSSLLALVPPAATAILRIDWKVARASPLYSRLLVEGGKLGLLDPAKPHCVVLPDAVDEIVVALMGTGSAGAFMLLQTHDESVVRGCMPELVGEASDIEPPVAGYPASRMRDGQIAVAVDGLFVIGNRPDVEHALAKGRRAEPVAPITRGLDLRPGAVLSVYREGPGFFLDADRVSIVLETTSAHLALRVSGTVASPEQASSLLLQATTKRAEIVSKGTSADDEEKRTLRRLVSAVHLAANGSRLEAEIDVKGGADEQLPVVRLLAGLALLRAIE